MIGDITGRLPVTDHCTGSPTVTKQWCMQVVVSQATAAAVREARQQGRPLWRVSSTVFAHIASDQLLAPLGHFAGEEACRQYPQIPAGLFVEGELKKIALAPHKHD